MAGLQKLKSDMLLSSPHIHRGYVYPDGLSRSENLLNIINLHIDRYSKHGLLEDSTTLNTSLATRQQSLSSTLGFYHDQSYYH